MINCSKVLSRVPVDRLCSIDVVCVEVVCCDLGWATGDHVGADQSFHRRESRDLAALVFHMTGGTDTAQFDSLTPAKWV